MNGTRVASRTAFAVAAGLAAAAALAADYPTPAEGDWVVKDFRFHDGTTLPEVRMHYSTVGASTGEPVVILHGTGQSGAALLGASFAGELFGPGQPLDATKYYVILPDAIGHGKSSKPSDGMKATFPHYDYDDLVGAEYRLLTEHLGIRHARLILGNSMGGMMTWLFAEKWPGYTDVAVPMASTPTAMSGRNWMMLRLIVDSIRNDPAWMNGNYTTQPASACFAFTFFNLAMSGGNMALQKAAPNSAKADALVDARLAAPPSQDANDMLYQWDGSRDFDPSAGLEKITAQLLVINSADDERNPPDLGIVDREIRRVRNGRVFLIPESEDTAGHSTTGSAKWWKRELDAVLKSAPRLGS